MRYFDLKGFLSALVLTLLGLTPGMRLFAQDFRVGIPEGHTDQLESVRFGGEGRFILTVGADETLRLWETASGHLLRTISTDELFDGDIDRDGKFILANTPDSIRLWEIATGQALFTRSGRHARFLTDGKVLASTLLEDSAFVFDPHTDDGYAFPLVSPNGLSTVSPNGQYACFSSAYSDKLEIVDLRERSTIGLTRVSDGVEKITFSPDSRRFATVAADGRTVTIHDAVKGQVLTRVTHPHDIEDISFTPDSRYFVIVSDDAKLVFHQVRNGKVHRVADIGSTRMNAVVFSPDGKYLVISGYDPTQVWDAVDVKLLYRLSGNTETPVISPDSRYMLTYVYDGRGAALLNLGTGKIFQHLTSRTSRAQLKQFLPDQRLLLTTTDRHGVTRIWNPARGEQIHEFTKHSGGFVQSIHPEKNLILTTSTADHTAKVWNGITGEVTHTLYADAVWHEQPSTFWNAAFSPEGELVFINASKAVGGGGLDVFETATGRLRYRKPGGLSCYFRFHPDNMFLTYFVSDTVSLYETSTGSLVKHLVGHPDKVVNAAFSGDYNRIITADNRTVKVWTVAGANLRTFTGVTGNIQDVALSHNGNIAVACDAEAIYVWDVSSGVLLYRMVTGAVTVKFSPDGKHLASLDGEEVLTLWDVNSGLLLHRMENAKLNHFYDDDAIAFSPTGGYVTTNIGAPNVWDVASGKLVATALTLEDEYAIVLPSGYYQSSPGAARDLFFRDGVQTLGIQQLDLRYNRPDLVTQLFGTITGEDNHVIQEAMTQAYHKRLRKMGIDESAFDAALSVPVLEVVNISDIKPEQATEQLRLHIRASDSLYTLHTFNLWINEVPLYGKYGRDDISGRHQLDTVVIVSLSEGMNRIEAAVTNVMGTESFRYPLSVSYAPEVRYRPKLYFVGIGINQYVDSTMNLNYAAKDIRDLTAEFTRRHPNCHVDTLINAEATRENILAVRSRLMQTNINDKVIISFSGHGVLDDSLNFWFATHDLDFTAPQTRGLRFETLEELLQGIPARRKLLLIDACNSGEVDTETVSGSGGTFIHPEETEGKISSFSPRGAELLANENHISLQHSFDLMKEMFANLNHSNGVMVISAAGGREYAFEGRDYSNGVFTWVIKQALYDNNADMDESGGVSVGELKKYVSREVSRLTLGKQKPTTRTETLAYDWPLFNESEGLSAHAVAKKLYDAAEQLNREDREKEAVDLYVRVVDLLKADSNHVNREYASLCHYLGTYFEGEGNLRRAADHYREEVHVRKRIKRKSVAYHEALSALVRLYSSDNHPDLEDLLFEVADIARIVYSERSLPHAYALNQIGVFLSDRGEHTEAIPYYERAVAIIELEGKSNTRVYSEMKEQFENYAIIAGNLAYAYRVTGNVQAAVPFYEKAIATLSNDLFGKNEQYATTLNALAICYEQLRDVAKADSLYKESLQQFRNLNATHHPDFIYIYENLARLNAATGNWTDADRYYDDIRLLLSASADHDPAHAAILLNDHAILCQTLGDYAKARQLYTEALTFCETASHERQTNCDVINRNLENLLQRIKD